MFKIEIKRFKNLSLRGRYTVMLSIIILVCMGLLAMSLIAFSSSYWYRRNESLLSENAHNVADSASELLSGGYITMYGASENSIATLCSSLSLISTSISADVFICDTSGHVFMCRDLVVNGFVVPDGYCETHSELVISGEILEKSLEGSFSTVSNIDNQYAETQYVVGEPVQVAGQTVAVVFAVAPVSSSIISFISPITKLFCAAAALALLVAFICVYHTAGNLTKPLKKMSEATKSYAVGDFSPRIDIKSNDEMGQLAQAFNTMANSLAQLESSRRSFVANVSHELKTPMTSIGGFIDGMLDGTVPPDQQQKYLRIVSTVVRRLSRIVVSMLNLSKIEAGQLDLKMREVDLRDMLVTTLLMFEQNIEEKSIDIRGLDSMDDFTVMADNDMLGQVVYNLIDNAVKFTPEKGYIRVSVRENDGFIETTVRNSGSGIAADELDKIFERFYKVDKSRSFDKKSTGLGLYIVKSILELHHGTISADSEVGNYTQFTFRIPKES